MKNIETANEIELGMSVVFRSNPKRLFTVIQFNLKNQVTLLAIDDRGAPHVLKEVSIFALYIPNRDFE